MELYNMDVLADINQGRYAELLRDAEIERMLRNKRNGEHRGAEEAPCDEEGSQPIGLLATLLALPGRLKLA
jgi:hypothetical protein